MSNGIDKSDAAKHPTQGGKAPDPGAVDRFARSGIEDGPNRAEQGKLDRQRSGNSR